nr:cation transporter [Veronia nyctiphanis]
MLTEQEKDVSPVYKPDISTSDNAQVNLKTDTANQLILTGMTCASCVSSVEKALTAVNGVTSVNVNLAERTAQVKGQDVSADSLINAIIDAGYGAELIEDDVTRREKQNQQQAEIYQRHLKHALIALGVGIPLMLWGVFGGSMTVNSTTSQISWGIISSICFALLATTGKAYFKGAFNAIRHRRANMDSLIALGTSAAWLYSTVVVLAPAFFPESARHVYFEATAMILGLITLGHAIEAKARASASSALDKLLDLQPVTTTLVTDSGEKEISLKEVTVGVALRIYPANAFQ